MTDDTQFYREIWEESNLQPGEQQSRTQMQLIQSIYNPTTSPKNSDELEPVMIQGMDMEGNRTGKHLVGWRLKQ